MQISNETRTDSAKPTTRIAAALAYRNDEIVGRFARRHDVSIEAAAHLFEECKKFLVTCVLFDGTCSPSPQLDEMWHHFILHTRAYAEYCGLLGRFVHHNPTETPVIDGRAEMLAFADQVCGGIDRDIWPKVGVTACDSSCSGDGYCSES